MLSTGRGVTFVATMTMPGDRYWITSSAVANSVSGMVRPSATVQEPAGALLSSGGLMWRKVISSARS
jgi:hypothetical protein